MPTRGILLDGDELKRRRLLLRLSSAEVARALELHPNHYNRIERGRKRVSLEMLARIEGYFEADPGKHELVHLSDLPSFPPPTEEN